MKRGEGVPQQIVIGTMASQDNGVHALAFCFFWAKPKEGRCGSWKGCLQVHASLGQINLGR